MSFVRLSRWTLGVAVTAAASCIVAAALLVGNASSAQRPASHVRLLPALPTNKLPALAKHKLTVVRGFDGNYAVGTITNLTPYTWQFVQQGSLTTSPEPRWSSDFPETLMPGQQFVYRLNYYQQVHPTTWAYDGWFTYKADGVQGPNYLSIDLFGNRCTGGIFCVGSEAPLAVTAYDTSTAPSYVNGRIQFGTPISNSEIGWTAGGSTTVFGTDTYANFDYTFQTRGDYTLDASKAPEQQIGDLLNAMCGGTSGTSCNFTATGPLTWTLGQRESYGVHVNIDCDHPPGTATEKPGGKGTKRRWVGSAQQPPPPDDRDRGWREVTITESHSTAISAGSSVFGGIKAKIFGIIELEVQAKFGVEAEWEHTVDTTKSVKQFIPANSIGGMWVAPVVGAVTGTLVVSTDLATYTITNFKATQDGVSPSLNIPPYDVIAYTRPLTAAEYQEEHALVCPAGKKPPPVGRGAGGRPSERLSPRRVTS